MVAQTKKTTTLKKLNLKDMLHFLAHIGNLSPQDSLKKHDFTVLEKECFPKQ